MSDDEIRSFLAASRAKQGLPPVVKDPATIARIVALLKPNGRSQR